MRSAETILAGISSLVFPVALWGLWTALKRAQRREAWESTRAEARASRRLSERKDMRALATYSPEMD